MLGARSELKDLTGGLKTIDPNYLATLATNITDNYLNNQSKASVLLPEWSTGNESIISNSGFTEAAADHLKSL